MIFKSKTQDGKAQDGKAQDGTAVAQPPAHYTLPDVSGYFPAGVGGPADSAGADALAARIENVTLYQLRPKLGDDPLASGALTLREPVAGTADEVALVGQCDDTLFYVLSDDAVTKKNRAEFVLLLPEVCLVLNLDECDDDDILRVESLFAARTKFHVEGLLPRDLPTDFVSKSIYGLSRSVSQLAVSAGEMGAAKIEAYGEKKKEGVTECADPVKVGRGSIALAKGTRAASEMTLSAATTVSGAISSALGGAAGGALTAKEGDGAVKSMVRNVLLASALGYAEIGNGAAEAYERMVGEAKAQATTYVDKRYGTEAAELARHTTGAAANFGRTALTARRVVNVKKLVKSAVKQRVKEQVKATIR